MGERQNTPNTIAPGASRLAWASLILGILGLLGSVVLVGVLLAIPAITCGHLVRARLRPGTGSGRGMATAGLAMGYLAVLVFLGMLPALSAAREAARRVNCSGDLKALGCALRMYAADYDAHFPDNGWPDLVRLNYCNAMKVYTCPSTTTAEATSIEGFDPGRHSDYLYFGKGLTEACNGHDPKLTILACDKPGNHRKFMNVVFADGHVKGHAGTADVVELARREKLYLPGD